MTTQNLISRDFHGITIRQRSDGYFDATSMCKATGKLFKDYCRLKSTQEYLDVFSLKGGIPLFKIIEVKSGRYGGSWIHPKASINLAQWCSPEFAVMVTDWVFELLTEGSVSLNPEQSKQKAAQLVHSIQ
ncbi:MAG: KilA-N domain-containing protein [Candidatus Marithrix sp.]|nr:KilA-N domain-containing protein [Candidatus Marithrix sp.]